MPYDFKAATLSTNGLILALGTTLEIQNGLIGTTATTDWLSRLSSKGYSNGPTGAWKGEWVSVYQFLSYGAGQCFVGGTGASGPYTGLCLINTPLHNSSIATFDVVFDSGNTMSAWAAANIAKTRQDCVALVGNYTDTTVVTGTYNKYTEDFGVTSANTEYISYIAGRKQIDLKSINPSWRSSYFTSNCSSDVAGIMALNSGISDVSTVVAGVGATKALKNIVNLTQQYSDTDVTYLADGNVNPIRQFAGVGIYLMGNKTFKNDSTNILNRLNIMVALNYIKRSLKDILREYLFVPNTAVTKATVVRRVSTFLSGLYVLSSAAGGSYTVTPGTNDAPNTLTINVLLAIAPSTEYITLNVVNDETGTTISTVTIN